jgi:hypothetical protein
MKIPFTLDFRPVPEGDLTVLGTASNGEPVKFKTKAQALRDFKDGKLDSVRWSPIVFVNDDKLKKPVVFNEPELENFAASFVGQPFLKDHGEAYEDRGGTIIESGIVERNGKKAFKQTLEAVKPWAIEGYLDGTIDRYSIGWDAEEKICTVCAVEFNEPGCRHDIPHVGRMDKTSGKKVKILMKGLEGMETSAVIRPASTGTGNEEFALSLSLFKKGNNAPVIQTDGSMKEGQMLEKIRQMVGLPAATETEALSALEARLTPQKPGVPKALCAALGLPETAPEDEVIGKVVGLTAPGNYTPKAEHDKTLDELATYKAKEKVAAGKAAMKITPAMEVWALDYAKRDPAAFDSFLAHAPVQMPGGQGQPTPSFDRTETPNTSVAGLTADELFVAKRMGRTPEEFVKDKKTVAEYEARIAATN